MSLADGGRADIVARTGWRDEVIEAAAKEALGGDAIVDAHDAGAGSHPDLQPDQTWRGQDRAQARVVLAIGLCLALHGEGWAARKPPRLCRTVRETHR